MKHNETQIECALIQPALPVFYKAKIIRTALSLSPQGRTPTANEVAQAAVLRSAFLRRLKMCKRLIDLNRTRRAQVLCAYAKVVWRRH